MVDYNIKDRLVRWRKRQEGVRRGVFVGVPSNSDGVGTLSPFDRPPTIDKGWTPMRSNAAGCSSRRTVPTTDLRLSVSIQPLLIRIFHLPPPYHLIATT